MFDLLGLENSIARSRALLHAAAVGAKLHEAGELEDRLAALEWITAARRRTPDDDEDDHL